MSRLEPPLLPCWLTVDPRVGPRWPSGAFIGLRRLVLAFVHCSLNRISVSIVKQMKKKNIQWAQTTMHVVWAIPAPCIDFRWPALALVGPSLALIGLRWPSCAFVGPAWAYVGLRAL
jgi:hypothetical protein